MRVLPSAQAPNSSMRRASITSGRRAAAPSTTVGWPKAHAAAALLFLFITELLAEYGLVNRRRMALRTRSGHLGDGLAKARQREREQHRADHG
ncbi:MAG TPA: hypothetical protein PLK10_09855, partial [Ottowia sp.]|nr:hypothetical protein [Ottowia sp.]